MAMVDAFSSKPLFVTSRDRGIARRTFGTWDARVACGVICAWDEDRAYAMRVALVVKKHATSDAQHDACIVAALLYSLRRQKRLPDHVMHRLFDNDVCQLVDACASQECDDDSEDVQLVRISANLVGMCDVRGALCALQNDVPLAMLNKFDSLSDEICERAVSILDPDKLRHIKDNITIQTSQTYHSSFLICHNIQRLFPLSVVSYHIRVKTAHSVFFKMRRLGLNDTTKIHDIIGVRILVSDVTACYTLLHHLQESFCLERIHDYIEEPKPNGYQSLHCVIHVSDALLEIQVRTLDMHLNAEEGESAHRRYKTAQFRELVLA